MPPPPPLATPQSGPGLDQTRMTGAPQPTPAETPTDPGLIHHQILEGALDQGLCQSPHHALTTDPSPDLVPGQNPGGQYQTHQNSLLP